MTSNAGPQPNVKQAVPFFMVTDMDQSLHFYTQGLGFEIQMKWEPNGTIEWCWLQLDAVGLMLQSYREPQRPVEKLGLGVQLFFMCEDALAQYEKIKAQGIQSDEPFVGNGMWVVELKDPDGYKLAFESPTEVAEGTRYSEWVAA